MYILVRIVVVFFVVALVMAILTVPVVFLAFPRMAIVNKLLSGFGMAFIASAWGGFWFYIERRKRNRSAIR